MQPPTLIYRTYAQILAIEGTSLVLYLHFTDKEIKTSEVKGLHKQGCRNSC